MLLKAWMPTLFFVAVLLCGCVQALEEGTPPPGTISEPLPGRNRETAAEVVPEPGQTEADLTADRAEVTALAQQKSLMEEMQGDAPLNETARRCYVVLGELKSNVEKTARDLDDGGKEITRLIRTSDELSRNVSELVELWPDNKAFLDVCSSAKRQVLILNDELARVPRKWTHVRWAFRDTVREITRLRLRARDQAEAEPKPKLVLGKDGKPIVDKQGNFVYVEEAGAAPLDQSVARRDENLKRLQSMRAQMRAQEEARKAKQMPTDLDGN